MYIYICIFIYLNACIYIYITYLFNHVYIYTHHIVCVEISEFETICLALEVCREDTHRCGKVSRRSRKSSSAYCNTGISSTTYHSQSIGYHKGPCLRIIFPTALPFGVTSLDRTNQHQWAPSSGSILLSPSSTWAVLPCSQCYPQGSTLDRPEHQLAPYSLAGSAELRSHGSLLFQFWW